MNTIFYNGKIALANFNSSYEEALAVKDGKIFKIGTTKEILALKTENTILIDLDNRLLLPGFNDSHMHLLNYGYSLSNINLAGTKSIDEIIEKVRDVIRDENIEEDTWINGRGWNHDYFEEKRFPTRDDLDKMSTKHPIVLRRACGHITVVNSRALELAGITKYTEQVESGEFNFEEGIFRENSSILIKKHIPELTVEELKKMLLEAMKEANKAGITSVQTDDFEVISEENYENVFKAYEELKEEGKMTLRVYEQCLLQNENILRDLLDKGYNTGHGDEIFKIGPLKLLADGSLGARTAALTKPYADDSMTFGMPVFNQEEIDNLVKIAHNKGMQIAVHCIGDKAMYMALEALEKALKENPKDDHRHGIVHCQITDEYLLDKFKELNAMAYIQPIFLDYDWKIVETRVGSQLAKTSYNWKTFIDKGVHIACGSDCPVESLDVLNGIYEAVTRKDLQGKPEGGWIPEQKLTVEEAVYGYTMAGAYTSFEEDIKGSIEEGKLADFVVLSENIFEVPEDHIKDLEIDMTICNGNIVYKK